MMDVDKIEQMILNFAKLPLPAPAGPASYPVKHMHLPAKAVEADEEVTRSRPFAPTISSNRPRTFHR